MKTTPTPCPNYWHTRIPMPTEQEDALWLLSGLKTKDEISEVTPEVFEKVFNINRQYLYRGDFLAPINEINLKGCTCYLGDEGLSGFCITADGYLKNLFSNAHTGTFLNRVAEIVKGKVDVVSCIISESTGEAFVKRCEEAFGFVKCAMSGDFTFKFCNCYGPEFTANFISKWGKPRRVYMCKDKYSDLSTALAVKAYSESFLKTGD